MESSLELEPLMLLLQAPSKDVVTRIVTEAFTSRKAARQQDVAPSLVSILQEQLGIREEAELDLLVQSLIQLIRRCVYESPNEEGIQALFPQDFHPQLRRLLVQIIAKQQRGWRDQVIKSQVGLPHLESVSWNVSQQSPSESSEPKAPKATLSLQIRDTIKSENSSVRFEVTRASVAAMLESLYIVRDQLDSISR